MSNVIQNISELWKEIAGTAKFDHKEYDQELLRRIADRLGFSGQKITADHLKRNGISCEKLLQVVLQEMLPFSQMLGDLLAMFQRAGAQQSDHNIKISFDFNKSRELFQTDLDFFRQQTDAAINAVSSATAMIPMHPFEFVGDLRDSVYLRCSMLPKAVREWRHAYESLPYGKWPDYLPTRPVTGFPELDGQLGRLWDVLNASLWKYRHEYQKEKWKNSENVECRFWWDEKDRWLGSCIRETYETVEALKQKEPGEQKRSANVLACKLRKSLDECIMLPVDLHQQYRAVLDILNLPFWKHRYELYSAWVSTRILAAFQDRTVTFHVVDNALSFSFGGSHIATIGTTPPLELWAEVRTYYGTPKGRSRRNHIQPDYTLSIGDAFQADNSVAVVECKQYKKYSRSNFLNAAEDYAGGRPNSNIFLVNYGPVSKTLQNQVDPQYSNRIQFFGQVWPSSAEMIDFQKMLRSAVDDYYSTHYPIRIPEYSLPDKSCNVCLKWGFGPLDLDLHMFVSAPKQCYHVFYDNQYGEYDGFQAILDRDEQSGCGKETITLYKRARERCDFYVHDYHNSEHHGDPIRILIEVEGDTMFAVSRTEPIPSGCCWHPVVIEGEKLRIVDEIVGVAVLEEKETEMKT